MKRSVQRKGRYILHHAARIFLCQSDVLNDAILGGIGVHLPIGQPLNDLVVGWNLAGRLSDRGLYFDAHDTRVQFHRRQRQQHEDSKMTRYSAHIFPFLWLGYNDLAP